MPLESRSRMISFRLTAEEYDRFRRICSARGLRNVSELVRAAVNQLVGETSLEQARRSSEVQARVSSLELQLADLAFAVAHMESRLAIGHASALKSSSFAQSASGQ